MALAQRVAAGVVLALATANLAVGAQEVRDSKTEGPGVVFVIGGIGGIDLLPFSAQLTLPRAGVPHEIRNYVWTHGWGQLLQDLKDTEHAQRKAKELADEVRRIKEKQPDRPIYFLAKSGGTCLALLAAEQLPAGTLERIVLLSAAVSPTYDLRPALRATRRQIVSFHSPHDQLVLNLGTRALGTMDRVRGPSAGLRGFAVPAQLSDEDQKLHARLIQFSWDPSMLLQGYAGGHTGTSLPLFLSVHAAPWLR
jgi:hypothetical protein